MFTTEANHHKDSSRKLYVQKHPMDSTFLTINHHFHDGDDGGDDDVHQNEMSLRMKNDGGDGVHLNVNCLFQKKNEGENFRWIRHFLIPQKNGNESHHCYDGDDGDDNEHS